MRSEPVHRILVPFPPAQRPALALATLLFAIGCAGDPSAPATIEALPRELSADERQVIAAGNEFTFDLLRELARTRADSNLFVSPLSASMALGMTLNGARSTTFDGMRSALALDPLELPGINASYRDLIGLLRTLDPRVEMRVANSVWVRQGFPVEQSFLDVTAEFFDARAEELDFTAPSAVPTINDWVSTATAGRIPKLLERIEADEVMFLINALYFKGTWAERFDRLRTRTVPFHLADGGTVPVPMMSREGMISASIGQSVAAVDLPYGGGAFSMTLLLPAGNGTPGAIIAELSPAGWEALIASLRPVEMVLEVPRFRLEWSGELEDPLTALGMGEAFDEHRADFRGISQEVYDLGYQLFLTRVTQKTFVAVDEAGTEAAAATVVGVGVESMPPVLRFDRPFVFAIRERFSGTILFIGQVADPSRER